jgi:uncharacterized cupredoxin-like copper-binding protein
VVPPGLDRCPQEEGLVKRRVFLSCVGALVVLAPACGGGGSTVDVALSEFAVQPSTTSAEAGSITFTVTNDGPEDTHEFVVLRTDLGITELPVDENGAVVEEGEGIEVVDEIEDIPVGDSQELTVDLEAGSYVFICNIWDEDEQEAHYQEGMRTGFTVS